MASTANLEIQVRTDTAAAARGLDGLGEKAGKLGGMLKVAGAGVALAGVGIAKFGIDAVQAAGSLEQSAGAIDTVFGKTAGQMRKFSKDAAQAVGLSSNSYNELATILGTQLKNGGTSIAALGGKTNDLIKTGADLSSMFGGTTKEAVEALSSALKGERDPIERYGVSLNQSKIDAEAAALGFKKVGGSLSTEANQAATLSLIMKQTAAAHGNFAKESDTLQGKQQRLGAQWENMKTTIGAALLPLASKFFGYLNDTAGPAIGRLATWFGSLDFGKLLAGFTSGGSIITGFTPTIEKIKTAFMDAWVGVQPFITTMTTQVIPAIISLAQQYLPPLFAAIGSIIPPLLQAGVALVGLATAIWSRVVPVVQAFMPVVVTVFNSVAAVIRNALAIIKNTIQIVTAAINGDWGRVWDLIKKAPGLAFDLMKSVISGALGIIKGIVSTQIGLVQGIMDRAWTAIRTAVSNAWDRITSAVTTKIGELLGKVRAIPGQITSALGDLGSLLSAAGRKLIDGLIGGITGKIGALKDKLGSITSLIPDWKGPAKKDAKLLTPAGSLIMDGLIAAIDRKRAALRSTLVDVTNDISGGIGTPSATVNLSANRRTAAAGTIVTININGPTDRVGAAREIERLLQDYGVLVGRTA